MKLYATTTSERGKPVSKSGNEYIDININIEKAWFIKFTLRRSDAMPDENEGSGWVLYDSNDEPIYWATDKEITKLRKM